MQGTSTHSYTDVPADDVLQVQCGPYCSQLLRAEGECGKAAAHKEDSGAPGSLRAILPQPDSYAENGGASSGSRSPNGSSTSGTLYSQGPTLKAMASIRAQLIRLWASNRRAHLPHR